MKYDSQARKILKRGSLRRKSHISLCGPGGAEVVGMMPAHSAPHWVATKGSALLRAPTQEPDAGSEHDEERRREGHHRSHGALVDAGRDLDSRLGGDLLGDDLGGRRLGGDGVAGGAGGGRVGQCPLGHPLEGVPVLGGRGDRRGVVQPPGGGVVDPLGRGEDDLVVVRTAHGGDGRGDRGGVLEARLVREDVGELQHASLVGLPPVAGLELEALLRRSVDVQLEQTLVRAGIDDVPVVLVADARNVDTHEGVVVRAADVSDDRCGRGDDDRGLGRTRTRTRTHVRGRTGGASDDDDEGGCRDGEPLEVESHDGPPFMFFGF